MKIAITIEMGKAGSNTVIIELPKSLFTRAASKRTAGARAFAKAPGGRQTGIKLYVFEVEY